ncbi:MAG TPA: response regulator transcription factor [Chloroflexi bacterium]|nr:response regulator transcription factor [Chloroflexota bacterium]HPO57493.1 LuxR C-terminal-related transcriptional regulator [Anaerolineaceae bacterium]
MTLVLFLPDKDQVLLYSSPLPPEELVKAVKKGLWVPPEPYEMPALASASLLASRVGSTVIIHLVRSPGEPGGEQQIDQLLTPRQQEVLRSLAAGKTAKELAAGWGVSKRTISYHIQEIKRRLEGDSLHECIRRAVELGLKLDENRPP